MNDRNASGQQQRHMYREAERRSGEINETFLEMVADGMTREDLEKNIARRPSLWGRFEGWLDKLPSKG